jgi:drug/metabolite transporter (DMT)-like permease
LSALGLTLLLGTALLWAALDAARKALGNETGASALAAALTAGQIPLYLLWALLDDAPLHISLPYLLVGPVSSVLNVVALVMFIRSITVAPLSLTIPLLSLTPVLTALASVPLLGEFPRLAQGLGIVLVVGGALALGLVGAAEEAERRAMLQGRLLMAGVAALWAFTGPVDKLALRYASLQVHVLVVSGGITVLLVGWLAARKELATFRPLAARPGLLALAMALGAGALGTQLMAFSHALVSVVETAKRGVGMASSLLLGRLFFNEPITLAKLATVGVMALGVALLLLT